MLRVVRIFLRLRCVDTSKNYNVIASPGILPDYRIREQYLIPLFDEIVKYQAY